MIISKELLSEVLGLEIIEFIEDFSGEYDPVLQIDYKDGVLLLNIHELAHKCKEWADKNHSWIDSNTSFVSVGIRGNGNQIKAFNGYDLKLDEPSLIFKACEWILEQKDTI